MQWLTNGLKALSNWQMYAIAGGLSLALIGGSFAAGYLIGGRNEARIQIKEVEKRVYVPTKEIQEVQVRNVKLEQELAKQLQASRTEAQSIRNQLANRPASDSCTIDPANVSLLNQAIANGAPSGPAGVSADQGTTVACRDLELWAADAATQYNEVATRNNALVDWVDRELIQPQQ